MPWRSRSTDPSVRLNVSHSCADAVSAEPATGIVACVTIVRAAPDAGSVRLSVNMPTAATSPVVVCANLRIENVPVTCDVASTAPGVMGVGVVGDSADGVCGVSDGVVGSGVDGVVGSGVVGGVVGGTVGGAAGGVSGGVVGSVGGVGLSGVVNEPVTGMINLPDVA